MPTFAAFNCLFQRTARLNNALHLSLSPNQLALPACSPAISSLSRIVQVWTI